MSWLSDRIAGAPISWGVCEQPGWGLQLPRDTVLEEMTSCGVAATELGPAGFLPTDVGDARRELERYQIELVGGFVAVVLHRPTLLDDAVAAIDAHARRIAALDGETVVLAAGLGDDYRSAQPIDDDGWRVLLDALPRVEEVVHAQDVDVVLHPHLGTAVERPEHIERVFEHSDIGFCLDTGHIALGGGDPVAIARDIGDRVMLVHLKDVDLGVAARNGLGPDADTVDQPYVDAVRAGVYRPVGRGDLHLSAIVERFERECYPGWYVIEQDVSLDTLPEPGTGPVDWMRTSVEYLLGFDTGVE